MPKVTFAGRSLSLPRNPWLRRALGVALILLGCLGFLPVLGFWMIPLGLAVLAVDSPAARRLRRRLEAAVGRLRRAWARRRSGADRS